MANFPILKMINIDGRQVPFVYPQHKKEVGGYAETGEDNPLPTYDKSALAALDELKTLIEEQESKTKSVEVTNNPTDYPDSAVKQELELIKRENTEIKQAQSDIISALQTSNENLQSTNEALLSVIKDNRLQSDAQLTGSSAEQDIRITGAKRDEITVFPRKVRQSGGTETFSVPPGVTSILFVHIVYQVSGDFADEQGHNFWAAPFEGSTGRVLFGTTSDYNSLMEYSTSISASSRGSFTFMFNPYADNMINPQQDVLMKMPVVFNDMRLKLNIEGEFDDNEGIDSEIIGRFNYN